MQNRKVSVEYAIKVVMYLVLYPFMLGIFGLMLAGIAFVAVNKFSPWLLIPLLAIALSIPTCYYSFGLVKWRIWAFNNVINVFELQNSRDSHPLLAIAENTNWPITQKNKERVKEIEDRLRGPVEFTDDPEVAEATEIFYSKAKLYGYLGLYLLLTILGIAANIPDYGPDSALVVVLIDILFFVAVGYYTVKTIKKLQHSAPLIVLSNDGITSETAGFWPWKDIYDENSNYIWGDTPYWELKYSCPAGDIIVQQKLLDTSPLNIQHLLYVYRGRHDKKTGATTTKNLKIPSAVAAMSKWRPFRSKSLTL